MRWLVVVIALAGCRQLFGLDDPKPARDAHDDSAPSDGRIGDASDAMPGIDANPACLAMAHATFGGHHYYQLAAAGDWPTDETSCAGTGGHLVEIETMLENDFIKTEFTTANIWIGLSDPTMTDTYVWTDGTPLGTYNDFQNNMIPMSTHDCVAMDATSWKVLDCVQGLPGVCECE